MMKATRFFLISFVLFGYSITQAQNSAGLNIGYSMSKFQYGSIGYTKGWFGAESRIFTNSVLSQSPDFALVSTFKIIQKPDYQVYLGLGAQIDFDWDEHDVILPIGAYIFPFENKKLAIQLEIAPKVVSPQMLGSFGMRYYLTEYEKDREMVIVDFNRALFVTVAGTAIGPGIQYAWFQKNLDLHLGLTSYPMTNAYGGIYYHFMKNDRTHMTHPYIGADVGYVFNYVVPGISGYIPFGLQKIYANRLTVCYEVAAIYVEEDFYPWFGLKIGKAILKN